MAKFTADNIEQGFVEPKIINRNVVLMNEKGTVNFRFCRAKVKISSHSGAYINEYESQRGVMMVPNGAQILPYLLRNKEWCVVMIEQFRIAVSRQTIECPGGEVDLDDVQVVMAKELGEEAKIHVDPGRVKIVFRELIQPSIMNAWAYGGIIELDQAEVQDQAIGGEWYFGEYTAVVIKPLIEMLKWRDSGNHHLDLWSSRLLDEVAKEVGLLKKCY